VTVSETGMSETVAGGGAPRRRPRHRKRFVNRRPDRLGAFLLGALPFIVIIVVYALASADRLAANPSDRILPSLASMANAFWTMAFTPETRTGDYLLWTDTAASLIRLGAGMGISALLALTLGISIGFLPLVRSALAPVVAAISLIPPLAVLPILFIAFGLGETAKIALIVIGTAPVMIRSIAKSVSEIPEEQIVKAETLGASTWQMITRIALPQAMPHLVTAARLGLVPAWIFLISAEAIAATGGLGYRIFLVRRYLAMDIILPYVAWITLIAYLLDFSLRTASARVFRWAHPKGAGL
jgi:NitT/TauT family transport system permease protein